MPKRQWHSWSIPEIHLIAIQYQYRIDFKHGNVRAYNSASRQGILDKVCAHMVPHPNRSRFKWTKETLIEEAKKYTRKIDFIIESVGAYESARRQRILDIVCAHMRPTTCELEDNGVPQNCEKSPSDTPVAMHSN